MILPATFKNESSSQMITISLEARDHAMKKGGELYLEYIVLQGCCIPYQPGPVVRFGRPNDPARFHAATMEGITVLIPHELPDVPLRINVNSFMGFQWLIVEGWRHA